MRIETQKWVTVKTEGAFSPEHCAISAPRGDRGEFLSTVNTAPRADNGAFLSPTPTMAPAQNPSTLCPALNTVGFRSPAPPAARSLSSSTPASRLQRSERGLRQRRNQRRQRCVSGARFHLSPRRPRRIPGAPLPATHFRQSSTPPCTDRGVDEALVYHALRGALPVVVNPPRRRLHGAFLAIARTAARATASSTPLPARTAGFRLSLSTSSIGCFI